MLFEVLDSKKHDRTDFDCGVEVLNSYLQRMAGQDQKRALTQVHVLAEEARIIGYFSLSAHSVSRENLPSGMVKGGYSELPFVLLGRLAIDRREQGKGYGSVLLHHALVLTRRNGQSLGIFGMVVDAKDEAAARFYEGFNFMRLETTSKRLILPISAFPKE